MILTALLAVAQPDPMPSPCSIGDQIEATSVASPFDGNFRLGALTVDGHFSFRVADLRVRGFQTIDVASNRVQLADGCWLSWRKTEGDRVVLTFVEDNNNLPMAVRRNSVPEGAPTIAGYRFVGATRGWDDSLPYIGIWVASDGSEKSRIVGFDADPTSRACQLYTDVPVRLALIASFPGLHGGYHLAVINDPPAGAPVHWVQITYPPRFVRGRPILQNC